MMIADVRFRFRLALFKRRNRCKAIREVIAFDCFPQVLCQRIRVIVELILIIIDP